jgi:hypothetical protein
MSADSLPAETNLHWTEESAEAFAHRLCFDFEAAANVPETVDGEPRALVEMVHEARARGLKLALVVYDDGDAANRNGPINGEIFAKCWERCGKPKDFFELEGR